MESEGVVKGRRCFVSTEVRQAVVPLPPSSGSWRQQWAKGVVELVEGKKKVVCKVRDGVLGRKV